MKPMVEVAKFEVAEKLSGLLDAVEHLKDSNYLIKILTQQLRGVIADRLTSYIAGLDFNRSLNMEEILASESARRRILTTIYFFDAATEIYDCDPYLQAAGHESSELYGGTHDADGFARFLLIGQQSELGGDAPATFIRAASDKDLTGPILPAIITNTSMRLPHEYVETLWKNPN